MFWIGYHKWWLGCVRTILGTGRVCSLSKIEQHLAVSAQGCAGADVERREHAADAGLGPERAVPEPGERGARPGRGVPLRSPRARTRPPARVFYTRYRVKKTVLRMERKTLYVVIKCLLHGA